MANQIIVKNKIENFNKSIFVSGDKSLSIRWVLFSSIAKGKSKAYNLLFSEDVLAAIDAVKKLGAKVKLNKNNCKIVAKGSPQELVNNVDAQSAYFGDSFSFR